MSVSPRALGGMAVMGLLLTACSRQDRAAPADAPALPATTAGAPAGAADCVYCWLIPVGEEPLELKDQVFGAQLLVRGRQAELVLDTLLGHEPDGKAIWRARARYPLGTLQDSMTVTNTCAAGARDPDLLTLAVVRNTGTEFFQVIRAWKIRPREYAIDSLPASSVGCFVEGFGEGAP